MPSCEKSSTAKDPRADPPEWKPRLESQEEQDGAAKGDEESKRPQSEAEDSKSNISFANSISSVVENFVSPDKQVSEAKKLVPRDNVPIVDFLPRGNEPILCPDGDSQVIEDSTDP